MQKESYESSQRHSSFASCSALPTSAAGRPMSKRKSADVNDLGVDDPKQVRLGANKDSNSKIQMGILKAKNDKNFE